MLGVPSNIPISLSLFSLLPFSLHLIKPFHTSSKLEWLRIELFWVFSHLQNGSLVKKKIHKTNNPQFPQITLSPPNSAAAGNGSGGGRGPSVVAFVVVHVLVGGGEGVHKGAGREVEAVVVLDGDNVDVVHDGVDRGEEVLQRVEDSRSWRRERVDGDARLQNPEDSFQETPQASLSSSC